MPKRKISSVNYIKGIVPEDYKCDDCGAHGVKLWREYETLADHTVLQCADCAEISQRKLHGSDWESPFKRGEGDQIGWRVPAIPVEGEDTYWGYTSVPQAGCEWWKNLPTRLGETMWLSEKKYKALMVIIEKLVGRHYRGLIIFDEPSFELFELAKRIYRTKDEKEFQGAIMYLVNFNK